MTLTPNYEGIWKGLSEESREMLLRQGASLPERSFAFTAEESFKRYAGKDPCVTWALDKILNPQVDALGLDYVSRLDHSVMPMIMAMTDRGMLVSETRLDALRADIERERAGLLGLLQGIADSEVNPGSTDQVRDVLLKRGVPLTKLTDGDQLSTGIEALEAFKDKDMFVAFLLQYRNASKMLNTYVEGIDELTNWGIDDRLHPELRHAKVYSGRLSGFLLTFPRPDTVWGKRIRECFIAPDDWSLCSWDLSQIEPRMLAHLSRDPAFMEVFRSGEDIYRGIGGSVLGKKADQITDDERQVFKMVMLAWMYGVSIPGLVEQVRAKGIRTDAQTMQEFMDAANSRFPGISRYRSEVLAQTRRDGFVRGPSGRIRCLPAIHFQGQGWPFSALREEAERQAFNFVCQEGAQYVEKMLMRQLWASKGRGNSKSEWFPLLQIHDDILLEVQNDNISSVNMDVQEALQVVSRQLQFRVPLKTDLKLGADWGNLAKLKAA